MNELTVLLNVLEVYKSAQTINKNLILPVVINLSGTIYFPDISINFTLNLLLKLVQDNTSF